MGRLKTIRNHRPKIYVMGDLHGAYRALCEVLNKVQFNYKKDTLIFIGDLADGWGEFDKCIRKMLKIVNFIPIIGNHDLYLLDYLKTGVPKQEWLKCGGEKTIAKIDRNTDIKNLLNIYFSKAKYYHTVGDKFFCHGGFNHKKLITKQKLLTFSINRQMYKTAIKYAKQKIKFNFFYDELDSIKLNEIFIGHSPTRSLKPDFKSNLINIDTGAGSGLAMCRCEVRAMDI